MFNCYKILVCGYYDLIFFFYKRKTAYEMRISDWSSDVCSSDLFIVEPARALAATAPGLIGIGRVAEFWRDLGGGLASGLYAAKKLIDGVAIFLGQRGHFAPNVTDLLPVYLLFLALRIGDHRFEFILG